MMEGTIKIEVDKETKAALSGEYQLRITCHNEQCSLAKELVNTTCSIVEIDGIDCTFCDSGKDQSPCIEVRFKLHPEEPLFSIYRIAKLAQAHLTQKITSADCIRKAQKGKSYA